MDKQQIRQKMLRKLKQQDDNERIKKSASIGQELFSSKEFKQAKIIMFYASLDYEVDTLPMMENALKDGKKICLPLIFRQGKILKPYRVTSVKEGLVTGPYSIRQPREDFSDEVALNEIDLVIVPGVAFDRDGNRLGHGKGYYDRFLRQLPADTPVIGLAFDFQLTEDLPVSSYDHPVSSVLSA